jgi:RNA polymerase sigma factor (TIGR02999 family)
MASAAYASGATITELLTAWHDGDDAAFDSLVPLVYNDLRRIAARHMRRERFDHTLDPTDLVHAAVMKMPGLRKIEWSGREHFFAMSARVMRQVLVDYARRRLRRQEAEAMFENSREEFRFLLELDRAAQELARIDPGLAAIFEMKYFGDRTVPEIAAATGLGEATVKRRWKAAKGWLHENISL